VFERPYFGLAFPEIQMQPHGNDTYKPNFFSFCSNTVVLIDFKMLWRSLISALFLFTVAINAASTPAPCKSDSTAFFLVLQQIADFSSYHISFHKHLIRNLNIHIVIIVCIYHWRMLLRCPRYSQRRLVANDKL
jgi:hypothetical protein